MASAPAVLSHAHELIEQIRAHPELIDDDEVALDAALTAVSCGVHIADAIFSIARSLESLANPPILVQQA